MSQHLVQRLEPYPHMMDPKEITPDIAHVPWWISTESELLSYAEKYREHKAQVKKETAVRNFIHSFGGVFQSRGENIVYYLKWFTFEAPMPYINIDNLEGQQTFRDWWLKKAFEKKVNEILEGLKVNFHLEGNLLYIASKETLKTEFFRLNTCDDLDNALYAAQTLDCSPCYANSREYYDVLKAQYVSHEPRRTLLKIGEETYYIYHENSLYENLSGILKKLGFKYRMHQYTKPSQFKYILHQEIEARQKKLNQLKSYLAAQ